MNGHMKSAGDGGDERANAAGSGLPDGQSQGVPYSGPLTAEEFDVLRTAYIYSHYEDMSQRQVADYLGVSAPTVARRLREARDLGWLYEAVVYRPPPHAREMARFFGDPALQHALAALLAGHDVHGRLEHVEVVPVAEDWEKSRERCANHAARQLEETLRNGEHVLACNWGRTTEAIARALRPATENPDLEVVPIFGDLGVDPRDPQFLEAHKYYANQVAGRIAERFGGRVPARLPFKAFIPLSYEEPELDIIRGYLRNDISYQIVFGREGDDGELQEEGYIHRAGTLISGVGAVEQRNAWAQYTQLMTADVGPRIEADDLDHMRAGGIVGDIAQHFVTIDGIDAGVPADLPRVAAMNERVVGLEPEHLQEVARRHAEDEGTGLGVLIVAGGAAKAGVTVAAVTSGAVNHLIVDQDLAGALVEQGA